MKGRNKRILAVALCGVLLTGCGDKKQNVPELIEPAASNVAYRPVELGSIGTTQILFGTVVPMEYCCFFDSYAGITKVAVGVGDYVEKGEVVAYADVDVAKEQLDNLNARLQNENQNYELNNKIAKVRIRQIEEGEPSQTAEKSKNVTKAKGERGLEERERLGKEGLKKEESIKHEGEPKSVESTEDTAALKSEEESQSTEEVTSGEKTESTEGGADEEKTESTEGLKGEEKTEGAEEGKGGENLETTEKPVGEGGSEDTEESGNVENTENTEDTGKSKKEKNTVDTAALAVEQENMRYDEILHKYRVKKLQEEINRQKKIISEGTLTAPHAGYVIYTKNLGQSTDAPAYENIVVLADSKDTCIELEETTLDYNYEDYEVKYMQLGGKQYDVTELSYSTEAQVLAKAGRTFPNVRLTCPDAGEFTLGTTYPIFYRKKKVDDVPIIGLDSLEGEEDDYFVYVKNENGEPEKRTITIGEKDNYYVQVVDGLEIGEEVYYESNARMPAKYEEYKVELSDYTVDNKAREYQLAEGQTFLYDAGCEGKIAEVAVKKGDEVEEGALLYVLESSEGKAALAAAKNNINSENTNYQKNVKQMEKSIKAEKDKNQKQILTYQKEIESVNHAYRLRGLEKSYNDMAKNNDGTGKISVYAKQSGTVSDIAVKTGEVVDAGSHILSIGTAAEDKLLVQMTALKDEKNYPANVAGFGETVTITAGDAVYQGVCTGMTVHREINLEKYYVTDEKEGAVISYCTTSGYSNPAFYVEMEDKSFYQNMPKAGLVTFSYIAMEDAVVVPTGIVQEGPNEADPRKTDYFVWRVVGDELVKQFVIVKPQDERFSDVNTTVILSGVKPQDILARGK